MDINQSHPWIDHHDQPQTEPIFDPFSSTFLNHNLIINPQEEDGGDQEEELDGDQEEEEELGALKEMMYRMAAMQPVEIDPASIRKPGRRNVRISDDPQSVAARNRRQRISEKIRILQQLVPGGTKMDTASMLEEAVRYLKFLKRQIRLLQKTDNHITTRFTPSLDDGGGFGIAPTNGGGIHIGGSNVGGDELGCFSNHHA